MKMTLLELVQKVLSAISSNEVNSIDDTTEAVQVADILQRVFLYQSSNRNWDNQKKLLAFDHSGTPDKPTHLKSPERLKELHIFRYNTARENGEFNMREVVFKHPDEFLRMTANRGINTPHTKLVADFGGTFLNIITNKAPSYWTTFDDVYIVCDSFDYAVDDALKASKTQMHATMMPDWQMRDDFVPPMPTEAFAGLLAEAISLAFVELSQVANQKAEQEAVRQRTWLSRKNFSLHGGVRTPNYGRRSSK